MTIFITENDRRRLEPCSKTPRRRTEHPQYLHALEAELERPNRPYRVATRRMTRTRPWKSGIWHLTRRRPLSTRNRQTSTPIGFRCCAPNAILGCRVGDVVRVKTPSGARRVRVEIVSAEHRPTPHSQPRMERHAA